MEVGNRFKSPQFNAGAAKASRGLAGVFSGRHQDELQLWRERDLGNARRGRLQIIVDVLQSIDVSAKTGRPQSMYQIERLSGLTYKRLQECMRDLRSIGLLDGSCEATDRGHRFLEEMSNNVI